MPTSYCQYRKDPGALPDCPRVVDEGEEYCPRHKLLVQQQKLDRDEKQRLKELNDRMARQVQTKLPETRRGLIEQCYEFVGNDVCLCGNRLEW